MSTDTKNNKIADNQQVISKDRVVAHDEVFTSEREVNAMLDLVKNETGSNRITIFRTRLWNRKFFSGGLLRRKESSLDMSNFSWVNQHKFSRHFLDNDGNLRY